ncbi:MAG TPA: DNA ligase [Gammaproteobacteria bacterium]|nr:DNA ligase [Gammaproteobacteria bacterium]
MQPLPHRLGVRALCVLLGALLLAPTAATAEDVVPPQVMLPEIYHGGIDVSKYWVSEKLDGVRGYWNGKILRTRAGHIIHAPEWFTAGWPDVPMDGELWVARGHFAEASAIIRRGDVDDPAWHKMHFMVFDLPADKGSFDEHVVRMRKLLKKADVAWLHPIRQFHVADVAALKAELDKVVAAGGEGLVLHRGTAHYQPGRSKDLLKYKPYDDAEARVVGYSPGEGKYKGMLGALIVERPDGLRFKIGSGFSDAERAKPPPIGSWITYRYNGLTRNGVPRFARFLRVRDLNAPPDEKQ